MSNVIKFPARKVAELISEDERLERIKKSLAKIDQLMLELGKLSNEHQGDGIAK